jgi:hypothetical protein
MQPYRQRRPENTALHRIAREHLETSLALANRSYPLGDGVPDHAEDEFRSYLRCRVTSASLRRASYLPPRARLPARAQAQHGPMGRSARRLGLLESHEDEDMLHWDHGGGLLARGSRVRRTTDVSSIPHGRRGSVSTPASASSPPTVPGPRTTHPVWRPNLFALDSLHLVVGRSRPEHVSSQKA